MQKTDELNQRLQELLEFQKTLLFATASSAAVPELSVAPFVYDAKGCFYIYVSELASHTANLRQNHYASVLFLGNEAEASNLFARERLIYQCQVREIGADEPLFNTQIQALTEKFGETVTLLKTLPDFHLFALSPQSGRYIAGFGRAYQINVAEQGLTFISAPIQK